MWALARLGISPLPPSVIIAFFRASFPALPYMSPLVGAPLPWGSPCQLQLASLPVDAVTGALMLMPPTPPPCRTAP